MFLQNKLIKLLFLLLLTNNVYAKDIISIQSGGKAVHWTSENPPHLTINVINGLKEGFWSSSGNIFPHVLTFALPKNKRFEALSFIAKNISEQGSWAHHIRISSADPFPHMGGWEEIAEIKLPSNGEEKIISLEGKRGRYFRLEIFSAQDITSNNVTFGKFKVLDIYNQ
tara:strand:- start:109 stop:615 length:507 start_codon:yes stop_codon:yes gene_type:complete